MDKDVQDVDVEAQTLLRSDSSHAVVGPAVPPETGSAPTQQAASVRTTAPPDTQLQQLTCGLNETYGAIVFWIAMSCSVILFNKFLYYGTFPYPLTLTCLHMALASVLTTVGRATGHIVVPALPLDTYVRTILPIGALYATSLGTSNMGAARLTVSFVQMIKALMPLVTLAVSVAAGLTRTSTTQVTVVAIMCVGVIVSSYGELLWNTLGVVFQVASVMAESSRLVATEILLQKVLPKSSPLVSISLFAPPCFLCLLPMALTFESDALLRLAVPHVAIAVFLNACTAFVLNFALVLLVQRTSGLVLTLAGIVKDVALIVASIFIYGNPVMPLQVGGYFIALVGLNMFNELKASKAVGETTLLALAQQALTNRQMAFISAGCVVLLCISVYQVTQSATVAE